MKKSLLKIILALILIASCESQAGLAEVYFPLNVGNSWTYTGYEPDWGGGEPIQKEYTFTIIGKEEIDGFTYYKFNDYFYIFPPPPDGIHRVTTGRETLFRYDSYADRALMIWSEEEAIRYDFTGNSWDPGPGFGESRLKQTGITCNIPAGQFFDCINFQFDWWSNGGPDAYAHGEYLAPNVGNIKFVRPGGSFLGLSEGQYVTFELESYTIVPEPATVLILGVSGMAILRKRKL